MHTIIINGKRYKTEGSTVTVVNDVVMVDGKVISQLSEERDTIEIKGGVANVICDKSLIVKGDITGKVEAGGSVSCNNIYGDIEAGGSINCDDVEGKVNAGGSINCDNIYTGDQK